MSGVVSSGPKEGGGSRHTSCGTAVPRSQQHGRLEAVFSEERVSEMTQAP